MIIPEIDFLIPSLLQSGLTVRVYTHFLVDAKLDKGLLRREAAHGVAGQDPKSRTTAQKGVHDGNQF